MSRIPLPSHSPAFNRQAGARSESPVPFPDRAVSPIPSGRHRDSANMSTISSSLAETRKKQTRKDEVGVFVTRLSIPFG